MSASFIYARHIGAITYPATFLTIGRLLLFPAHTITAIFGVYPATHTSLKSLVVPVFPATSISPKFKNECTPAVVVGAIGGRFTYSFTPTGLGMIVEVVDGISGKSIDLTEYDLW